MKKEVSKQGKQGLFLVFLTALISGFSIFINKFGVAGMNPFVFTGMKNLIVGIILVSAMILAWKVKEIKSLKKEYWSRLVLIGIIGGGVPFMLFFKGLQLTSAVQAAFLHKIMFVFVAFGAVLFLKERISKLYFVGALMLLVGLALVTGINDWAFGMGDVLIMLAVLF